MGREIGMRVKEQRGKGGGRAGEGKGDESWRGRGEWRGGRGGRAIEGREQV